MRTEHATVPDLVLFCRACGDVRQISAERRHCLCGLSAARYSADHVVLVGPGRIRPGAGDVRGTEMPVVRPSVPVGD